MNKKVAGGDITHGEIIAKIYERFPHLKLKFLSKRKILRRKLIKEQQFIDKAVICNEFGGELFKNSHSHMYLQTHDKYTFKKMKKVFKKKFNQKINDIRRPMNFRECCKYCTKDDDEFRFNDASTHEGHLRQNGKLTWFCNETAIKVSYICIKCKTRTNLKIKAVRLC